MRTVGSKRGRDAGPSAREIADAVFARYRTHDKADDAREAVDELTAEAATRFRNDGEATATEIERACAEMASVWQAEVPTRMDALDAGHVEAVATGWPPRRRDS